MVTDARHGSNIGLVATGVAAIAAIILLVSGVVWFIGSENPTTPAGYVGYVTKGAVFGQKRFLRLQTGPTSLGRTWLTHVINVSITPYNYDEEFAGPTLVLAKDSLPISFGVHFIFRIKPDRVKEFVERYSTTEGNDKPDLVVKVAYNNFLKERIRTFARDAVQRYDWETLKSKLPDMSAELQEKMMLITADTPFDPIQTVVGNIQPPAAVATAISEKLVASQTLERKQTEISIEQKDREKRVIQAHGIAEAMEIITTKLNGAYLQHEAIEAMRATLEKGNTYVYLPTTGSNMPLVQTMPGIKNK